MMNGLTLINVILITLIMGVFFYLTRASFQKVKLEKSALETYAKSLAGNEGVKAWRRGFAIEGAGLAFTADVFKEGDLRAGVVDVWRIRVKTKPAPRHWLTSKQKEIAAHADVEGLPIHKVQMLSESQQEQDLFADPKLKSLLSDLLKRRRCRQLEFSKGYLNVCIERDLATVAELKACVKDCQEIADAFVRALPNQKRLAQGASTGSVSGVPLGVPSSSYEKES